MDQLLERNLSGCLNKIQSPFFHSLPFWLPPPPSLWLIHLPPTPPHLFNSYPAYFIWTSSCFICLPKNVKEWTITFSLDVWLISPYPSQTPSLPPSPQRYLRCSPLNTSSSSKCSAYFKVSIHFITASFNRLKAPVGQVTINAPNYLFNGTKLNTETCSKAYYCAEGM